MICTGKDPGGRLAGRATRSSYRTSSASNEVSELRDFSPVGVHADVAQSGVIECVGDPGGLGRAPTQLRLWPPAQLVAGDGRSTAPATQQDPLGERVPPGA